MSALPVEGVILAGGRSRRMGGVLKPLVPLAEKPLLQHVIDRVRAQVRYLYLSVESERAEFDAFGLTQVPDLIPGSSGPLGGLLSVLRLLADTQSRWLLLLPCDAPFVPVDLALRLFTHAVGEESAGAVVRYRGQIQPTFSLWHRDLLPALEQSVTVDGMAGFKQFLRVMPLAELDWPRPDRGPEPFFNINDREALRQARSVFPV